MDTPKETYRNVETETKKTLRDVDGHDIGDDLGNAGDEARKNLGNAGDEIRRGVDDVDQEKDEWAREPKPYEPAGR